MPALLVRLEPELMKEFKHLCVDEGVSAQELIHRFIAKLVRSRRAEHERKDKNRSNE